MKRLAVLITLFPLVFTTTKAADSQYLRAAKETAKWLDSVALKTEKGLTWPADPNDAKSQFANLYSGSPGVILFYLQLYRATRNPDYLNRARAGADHLIETIAKETESGLYTGISGIGFTLIETYRVTGERKYQKAAVQCCELLRQRAVIRGAGVEWNDSTDIIAGNAGIGLFLLYAARELSLPELKALAQQAGNRLLELSISESRGKKWAMTAKFPRLMPNFSHGTAGIAYFLAVLYQDSKKKAYLDEAVAGAKYLQTVAVTEGDVCLIFHNEPDGKDLFYLSWCHGPAGTARLFYKLYQITSEKGWMDWVNRCARAITTSGIPQNRTAGYWNNVSQCCGSAGVAEFFLSLSEITKEPSHLAFAKQVTRDLLQRAQTDEQGQRWVQAEHRVRPQLLVAQTGFMQGAAGIGILLLRLYGTEQKRPLRLRLPDDPF